MSRCRHPACAWQRRDEGGGSHGRRRLTHAPACRGSKRGRWHGMQRQQAAPILLDGAGPPALAIICACAAMRTFDWPFACCFTSACAPGPRCLKCSFSIRQSHSHGRLNTNTLHRGSPPSKRWCFPLSAIFHWRCPLGTKATASSWRDAIGYYPAFPLYMTGQRSHAMPCRLSCA